MAVPENQLKETLNRVIREECNYDLIRDSRRL